MSATAILRQNQLQQIQKRDVEMESEEKEKVKHGRGNSKTAASLKF